MEGRSREWVVSLPISNWVPIVLEPMGKLQVAVKVNTIYQIGLHARRGFGRPEVSQSE